jgi:polar amino acid transport system substrate-binding protein
VTPKTFRLTLAGLCLIALPCVGETLLWGYSPSDPPPYVSIQANELQHSLTRTLGEAVAAATGREVRFIATPNNRIDDSLAVGRINIICNTLPEWLNTSDQLLWTQSLYEDADVVITRQAQPAPHSVTDLHGAIVGTTLGYHYSPAITTAFDQQTMIRHDVRDLPTRLKMLERERLDAVIDLRRAVKHVLPEEQTTFQISEWEVEHFSLRCAVANATDRASQQLAKKINDMISNGEIKHVVTRFD